MLDFNAKKPDSLECASMPKDVPAYESERDALLMAYQNTFVVRPELTRKLISYQGNKAQPGMRWLRYKEGFSAEFVKGVLDEAPGSVLDPFGGIGTTALTAAVSGRHSYSIEMMPVGVRCGKAILLVANRFNRSEIEACGETLIRAVRKDGDAAERFRFPHVPITRHAFPKETEAAIAKARAALDRMDNQCMRVVLDVACMSVLEEVSFTRKDGQYLRWDPRGRPLRAKWNKGPIPGFEDTLQKRLEEMASDADELKRLYGSHLEPTLIQGSALNELAALADQSIGLTVTSPPYANRYDYTRTYALELAWLGYDQKGFTTLRQSLLSATVENHSKAVWLEKTHPNQELVAKARLAVDNQAALREAVMVLEAKRDSLSNPHVIRLLTNYFQEMGLIIAELARVTRKGGHVVMVNDNVQYHGEEIPVDLILTDIAQTLGFKCEEISVLQRGKGNASQQMGRFGQRELRKCVYHWRMPET